MAIRSIILAILVGLITTGCAVSDSGDRSGTGGGPKISSGDGQLAEEIRKAKLGDGEIGVVITRNEHIPSRAVYFNMHDNENTSVEAARRVIAQHGGTLVELRSNGERLISFRLSGEVYTADPNRIFTDAGIFQTLTQYGGYSPEAHAETARFANSLINEYFRDAKLIVALHNTAEGEYSASSYLPGNERAVDASDVFVNPERDPDDFFFVTRREFFEEIRSAGFNAVLQDNANVTNDGSLSVYCGRHDIKYINIEAEHGHLLDQVKMIEFIQEVIKEPL
jgi:hypothetical protein